MYSAPKTEQPMFSRPKSRNRGARSEAVGNCPSGNDSNPTRRNSKGFRTVNI
jgi:hypothetical protein